MPPDVGAEAGRKLPSLHAGCRCGFGAVSREVQMCAFRRGTHATFLGAHTQCGKAEEACG